MTVLWCITGAGHLLEESADAICGRSDVAVAYSKAGYEVARMYGLAGRIESCCKESIKEESQGASHPLVGRLARKEYDHVIVSPCTANTAAKIACGIADSLVTNLVAQAVKTKTQVHIVPTDMEKKQKTRIPLYIDPKVCRNCEDCEAIPACPKGALRRDETIRLDLLRCDACKKCIPSCKCSAISFGREVAIHIRDIDIENTERLREMEGIRVYSDPGEIEI